MLLPFSNTIGTWVCLACREKLQVHLVTVTKGGSGFPVLYCIKCNEVPTKNDVIETLAAKHCLPFDEEKIRCEKYWNTT